MNCFQDQSSVSLALKMDGQELLGRALRVKKAAKKQKKKKLSQAEDVKMKQKGKQVKARKETSKPKMVKTKPTVKAEQAEKVRGKDESKKTGTKPKKPLRKVPLFGLCGGYGFNPFATSVY